MEQNHARAADKNKWLTSKNILYSHIIQLTVCPVFEASNSASSQIFQKLVSNYSINILHQRYIMCVWIKVEFNATNFYPKASLKLLCIRIHVFSVKLDFQLIFIHIHRSLFAPNVHPKQEKYQKINLSRSLHLISCTASFKSFNTLWNNLFCHSMYSRTQAF